MKVEVLLSISLSHRMMSSRVHSLATRANRQADAMNRKNTERMMVNSAIEKYRKAIYFMSKSFQLETDARSKTDNAASNAVSLDKGDSETKVVKPWVVC